MSVHLITSSELVSRRLMIAPVITSLMSHIEFYFHVSSHFVTLSRWWISRSGIKLFKVIILCNSANGVILIFLSQPVALPAQGHPGLLNPPWPRGTRSASASPAPTASRSSVGEKLSRRDHSQANTASWRRGGRRRTSHRKTNRNYGKRRERTNCGSKANSRQKREVTTSLAAAAASPLTTHRVIPPAIFSFSYLGKLAGATLSAAHIMLFNITTWTNKGLYLIPYGAWHYYSYFLLVSRWRYCLFPHSAFGGNRKSWVKPH